MYQAGRGSVEFASAAGPRWPARRRRPRQRSTSLLRSRTPRPVRSSMWTTPSCVVRRSTTSRGGWRPARCSAPVISRKWPGSRLLPDPGRGEPWSHQLRQGSCARVRGRAQGGRDRRAVRGDLRRVHGRPDLGRYPRTRPAPPGGGPAGLAGDRHPGRAGQHHRPPPGPDRRAGHRCRDGGRRVHRPPGRWPAARPGEGGGRSRRSPRARDWTWRGAPPTATPPTTCPC